MTVPGKSPLHIVRIEVVRLEHTVSSERLGTVEKETEVPPKGGHALGKKSADPIPGLAIENVIRIVITSVQPAIVKSRSRPAAAGAPEIFVPNLRPVHQI